MLSDTSERTRSETMTKRLLLVEDDAPLRRNLVRSLEKAGFLVASAATLKEAHEQAADSPPDYAVLDLNLGDGHGMELVHTLLDLRDETRIVILTGYDSIASSVVALKAGAVDYLAKPASADQIVAALLGGEGSVPGDGIEIPIRPTEFAGSTSNAFFEQCDRNVSEGTARRLEDAPAHFAAHSQPSAHQKANGLAWRWPPADALQPADRYRSAADDQGPPPSGPRAYVQHAFPSAQVHALPADRHRSSATGQGFEQDDRTTRLAFAHR